MPVQINELMVNASTGSGADAYLYVKTARAGKLEGESESRGFEGDIKVTSWNWGASASSAIGSGKATGRRTFKNLTVFKRVDSASVKLLSALATNDTVNEARLSMCKAGGRDTLGYFTLKLEGARITDLDITMGADGVPVEMVMFAFTKVEVTYRPQQATGSGGAQMTFTDQVLPV